MSDVFFLSSCDVSNAHDKFGLEVPNIGGVCTQPTPSQVLSYV